MTTRLRGLCCIGEQKSGEWYVRSMAHAQLRGWLVYGRSAPDVFGTAWPLAGYTDWQRSTAGLSGLTPPGFWRNWAGPKETRQAC